MTIMHSAATSASISEALSKANRGALRFTSRDQMLLASDLLPPCDFIVLLLAALVTNFLYSLLAPTVALESLAFHPAVLLGAALAPFILYDPQFAQLVSTGKTAALTRSFLVRVGATALLLLAIGGATRILDSLPGDWLLLWFGSSVALMSANRWAAARHVRRLQHKGALTEAVAVVGAGAIANRLNQYLLRTHTRNVELLGIFDDVSSGPPVDTSSTWPVDSIEQLIALGQSRRIDWIVIAVSEGDEPRIKVLVERLRILGVPIALCPQMIDSRLPCTAVDFVGSGMPVMLLADRPLKRWNVILKTATDAVGAWLLALLLLPILAAIAVAIRLDSKGPIVYRQRRHAFNNSEFDIYKFRTMHWQPPQAAAQLQQTLRNDPRVTRVGRWLRASSLDELPQLFNVLKGEMSLIGPRPHAVDMRTEQRLGWEITDRYAHRHRVKPGMTGWAQVNGARGATDTTAQLRRRIELDLFYIDHWSLWLDIKILFMTCRAVLKTTNAF